MAASVTCEYAQGGLRVPPCVVELSPKQGREPRGIHMSHMTHMYTPCGNRVAMTKQRRRAYRMRSRAPVASPTESARRVEQAVFRVIVIHQGSDLGRSSSSLRTGLQKQLVLVLGLALALASKRFCSTAAAGQRSFTPGFAGLCRLNACADLEARTLWLLLQQGTTSLLGRAWSSLVLTG